MTVPYPQITHCKNWYQRDGLIDSGNQQQDQVGDGTACVV